MGTDAGVPDLDHADVRADPVYRIKAEAFRALAHPARIKLIELLGTGERSVGDLRAELDLDSSGVSQHLTTLRRHGLVDSRKVGTSLRCRLRDIRVLDLLGLAGAILASRRWPENRLLSDALAADPRGDADAYAAPGPSRVAAARAQDR